MLLLQSGVKDEAVQQSCHSFVLGDILSVKFWWLPLDGLATFLRRNCGENIVLPALRVTSALLSVLVKNVMCRKRDPARGGYTSRETFVFISTKTLSVYILSIFKFYFIKHLS